MASQRFCLRWNNHQSNLLSVFDQLLHAETFTDVTLAVEGQYLKAHKMVLSACSPYFNALFVNHPEKHPIVILKDVPYSDMKSLLDFMYRGEVSVDQERLTAFLRVAESLRIKGLTEVNDDKPIGAAPTPPPPQLHRIQPYLLQQRTKAQNMLNINNNQQSLLGTALSSMPKRKRGRPRKLSGSSNGTGNDFDEYDRDGILQDSPKHEIKLPGDGYSGNEGSDDNRRESCDNDQDMNDCTDSRDSRSKKHKSQSKDRINNDNDHSTSVHLNNSPELSQRLFGVNKPPPPPPLPTSTAQTIFSSASTQIIQTTTNLTPVQQPVLNSSVSAAQIVAQLTSTMPQKQNISPASTQVLETLDPATHLPTALGLKIRSHPISHANQQQNKINNNINSTTTLLQQQLRGESLLSNSNCNSSSNGSNSNNTNENNSHTNISNSNNNNNNNNSNNNSNNISNNNNNNNNNNTNNNNINNNSNNSNNNSTANTKNPSAQSIEQSSNQQKEKHQCNSESSMLQPPSSNNLRHQFLLHMATNPIVKTEYLLKNDSNNDENVMPVDVPSPPLNNNAQIVKSELDGNASTIIDLVPSPPATNDTTTISHQAQVKDDSSPITPRNPRPIQRRRIRRKAQSTVDDQAEHLTEMSVRGLDLFRYASITEGVYQCTECAKENVQKTFKNKYSFQRHAFLYHEGKHRKVFPCPVCGKEFSRPDKMKNHLKMTHEGFVPKDVNYHPLNYLITAATAGEIQHLFHQMDQRTSPVRDINSTTLDGGNTTITQHPPSLPPPPLIKLKNEIHTIRHVHESSSSPPPLGAHEGSIIPTPQEEVK